MLSQKGAMALAKRLQAYWHAQGYPAARFWAEPVAERFAKVGIYEIHRVACNLENGLPPRYETAREGYHAEPPHDGAVTRRAETRARLGARSE